MNGMVSPLLSDPLREHEPRKMRRRMVHTVVRNLPRGLVIVPAACIEVALEAPH